MSKAKTILTSAEAAKILGISPDYVRRLINEGKIKALKFGNSWTMTPKAIAHIKRQRKLTTETETDES
jgi:excisionase family DNA binding protein